MFIGDKLPFRIDSALVGNIFFVMGYYSKDLCQKWFSGKTLRLFITLIIGVLLMLITILIDDDIHTFQVLSINALYFGKYPLMFIVGAVGGIISVFSISQILSRFKLRVVMEASNGMIITLGFQQLIMLIIKKFITPTYSIYMAIAISIIVYIVCFLIIKLSGRYFPALLGNRKLK